MANRKSQLKAMGSASAAEESVWQTLCQELDRGRVLPIVGARLTNRLLFSTGDEGELARLWSESAGLAWPAPATIGQAARHIGAIEGTDATGRHYLDFLKELLLARAGQSADFENDDEAQRRTVTELGVEIGYDIDPDRGDVNPLQVLANLPIPIYLTTSHHQILQRELKAAGRRPETQLCLWNEALSTIIDPEHRPDPDFEPSADRPLVFHLFGLDRYPESLVLSDDDQLAFLTYFVQDTVFSSGQVGGIPRVVQASLATYLLLFLGLAPLSTEFGLIRQATASDSYLLGRRSELLVDIGDGEDAAAQGTRQEYDEYVDRYLETIGLRYSPGPESRFLQTLEAEWANWSAS